MDTLDVRGLSCPEPVLRARKALQSLEAGGELVVLVETVTSRENVLRTVRSLGCEASYEAADEGYRLRVKKP